MAVLRQHAKRPAVNVQNARQQATARPWPVHVEPVVPSTRPHVVDVGDPLGINEHETSWAIEAVWGEDGLLCLNDPRISSWARDALPCEAPRCDEESDDHWFEHPDALVITRAESSL